MSTTKLDIYRSFNPRGEIFGRRRQRFLRSPEFDICKRMAGSLSLVPFDDAVHVRYFYRAIDTDQRSWMSPIMTRRDKSRRRHRVEIQSGPGGFPGPAGTALYRRKFERAYSRTSDRQQLGPSSSGEKHESSHGILLLLPPVGIISLTAGT
jgi:hypothetical protein